MLNPPTPPCNWQHTKKLKSIYTDFNFQKKLPKLNYMLGPWWCVLEMLCLRWDEAGQKMLPGDGQDLIRLFLFINSNLFNCYIHRQGPEPQERGFGLRLSTEELTGLCQVLLAGWGAEHVEWLWLPWSSRIRSRWVRLLCRIVASKEEMFTEQQVAPGFSTTPRGHLVLDMCMFITLQKSISLLRGKISFSQLSINKTVKGF